MTTSDLRGCARAARTALTTGYKRSARWPRGTHAAAPLAWALLVSRSMMQGTSSTTQRCACWAVRAPPCSHVLVCRDSVARDSLLCFIIAVCFDIAACHQGWRELQVIHRTLLQACFLDEDRELVASFQPNAAAWDAGASYTRDYVAPAQRAPGPHLPPAQIHPLAARRTVAHARATTQSCAEPGQAAFEGHSTYGADFGAKAVHRGQSAAARGPQHPVLPLEGSSTYADAFRGAQAPHKSAGPCAVSGSSASPKDAPFESATEYSARFQPNAFQVRYRYWMCGTASMHARA